MCLFFIVCVDCFLFKIKWNQSSVCMYVLWFFPTIAHRSTSHMTAVLLRTQRSSFLSVKLFYMSGSPESCEHTVSQASARTGALFTVHKVGGLSNDLFHEINVQQYLELMSFFWQKCKLKFSASNLWNVRIFCCISQWIQYLYVFKWLDKTCILDSDGYFLIFSHIHQIKNVMINQMWLQPQCEVWMSLVRILFTCIYIAVCPPCSSTSVEPAGHQKTVPVLVMWLGSDESSDVPDSETQTQSVSGCSCRKFFIVPTDQQHSPLPPLTEECCLQISAAWCECRGTNRCGVEASAVFQITRQSSWAHSVFTISTSEGMSNTPSSPHWF